MGIFALGGSIAPGTSLYEQKFFGIYYKILFFGLPFLELILLIIATLMVKRGISFWYCLYVFIPYILFIGMIAFIPDLNEKMKKEREAFFTSPHLSELEFRQLKLEFRSDSGKLWTNVLQQMKQDGFSHEEQFDRQSSAGEITPYFLQWQIDDTVKIVTLAGYISAGKTIYVGNDTQSGNFLIATSPDAREYVRHLFSGLPGMKCDYAALQEIWQNDALTAINQFLHFWPREKGSLPRESFVAIEQCLKAGNNVQALSIFNATQDKEFLDNVPYYQSDTTNVEDIEFWKYMNIMNWKMENLKRIPFFDTGDNTPLIGTAESLRFLRPDNTGSLGIETPEKIHQDAQNEYEYRISPPPSNMKEYIQEIKRK